MCHLDVAPDNVLIRSSDGAPILLDFGAARLEIKQRSQLVSAMLFKSGYSAPEQYTSSANRYGPWTDIYAAGATLYRAIAGSRPIEFDREVPEGPAAAGKGDRKWPLQGELPARDRCGSSAAAGGASSDSGRMARTASGRRIECGRRILCSHPHPSAGCDRPRLPPRAAAPLRAGPRPSPTRLSENVLRGWHSLSTQQRRFGLGAGSALALLALGASIVGPFLRQGLRRERLRPPLKAGGLPRSRRRHRRCRRIARPITLDPPGQHRHAAHQARRAGVGTAQGMARGKGGPGQSVHGKILRPAEHQRCVPGGRRTRKSDPARVAGAPATSSSASMAGTSRPPLICARAFKRWRQATKQHWRSGASGLAAVLQGHAARPRRPRRRPCHELARRLLLRQHDPSPRRQAGARLAGQGRRGGGRGRHVQSRQYARQRMEGKKGPRQGGQSAPGGRPGAAIRPRLPD